MRELTDSRNPSNLGETEPPPIERGDLAWTLPDLAAAMAAWFAAAIVSNSVVAIIAGLLGIPVNSMPRIVQVVANQAAFYALCFGSFGIWVRIHHDTLLWRSLGLRAPRISVSRILLSAEATFCAVAILGALIRIPDTENQMTELARNPASLMVMGAFAISVGPLCEELAFRGFLQPMLVQRVGALSGVVLTAIPFGLLHLSEYGYSWRHASIVAATGAAFGWMRHTSGSTVASALMHASYNATIFLTIVLQRMGIAL